MIFLQIGEFLIFTSFFSLSSSSESQPKEEKQERFEMDTPADNHQPPQEQSLQETTPQEQPPQKQTCGSEKQDDSDSYSSDSCTSYSSDSCSGSDSDSCSEEEVGDESNDGESTVTNRPTSLSRDTSPRAPTRSSGSQHRNVFQRLSSSEKSGKVANVNVSLTRWKM